MCDQSRQLDLQLNNLLAVLGSHRAAVSQVFINLVEDLLLLDFLIEHVFCLGLLILQAIHCVVGRLLVLLEGVLDLLDHLTLGIDLLKLEVGLCQALPLDFLINVGVFFIDSALLGQDIFDLRECQVLQTLQVFYSRFSNADIDVDLVLLLVELHDDLLLPLDEVFVIELSLLLIELDVVLLDALAQLFDLRV